MARIIPPAGYLFVWADNAASSVNVPDLHANFQLAKGGESIILTAPDQVTILDSITFGTQVNNVSQGRYPDGAGGIHVMSMPTPRAANAFNAPPVLALITNRTVFVSQNITFTATATDADLPPQSLTFTLDPGAPPTASISANGLFAWTPNAAPSPSTNYILSVRVTDNGIPPQNAARNFIVTVLPLPRITGIVHPPAGPISLSFSTVPGRTYRIEYKNDLNDLLWTTLSVGDTNAPGSVLTINDPAPSPIQRFYRIKVAGP